MTQIVRTKVFCKSHQTLAFLALQNNIMRTNAPLSSRFLEDDNSEDIPMGFIWQLVLLLLKTIDLFLVVAKFVEDFRERERERERELELERKRKRRRRK
jgi:hypothetical protein